MNHTPNTPHSHTPNALDYMSEARSTCRELLGILIEENRGLAAHKITEVEARLQLKKRLSLRLEKLLQEIKAEKTTWAANPTATNMALHLAEEIRVFQDYASKNAELLKAAHQIRADIVGVIRNTMEAQAPKVRTYGYNGAITPVNAGTTLLAREV